MVEVNPSSQFTIGMLDCLISSLEERRVELIQSVKKQIEASTIIVNRIYDALE